MFITVLCQQWTDWHAITNGCGLQYHQKKQSQYPTVHLYPIPCLSINLYNAFPVPSAVLTTTHIELTGMPLQMTVGFGTHKKMESLYANLHQSNFMLVDQSA